LYAPTGILQEIRRTQQGITLGTETNILSISFDGERGRDDGLPCRQFEI
jgi:hypothetical protein